MTKSNNNTESTLWVAIDVSKHKHDILIEYPNKTRKRMVIANTKKDFERLASLLISSKLNVSVALESTGYYHRAIGYFLIQQGFNLFLISGIATARTRECKFNSRDKNDKRDTEVILYLLQQGTVQYYYEPLLHDYNEIQELSRTYSRVSDRKTRLQHSVINHFLALYFPEAEKYFCSTRAEWFAEFFKKFPCPSIIVQYKEDEFVEKAWKLAGRKVDKENWLRDVYNTAKNSVGLPITLASNTLTMFRYILDEFADLCKRRKQLEIDADQYLLQNPDYCLLKTVPGIGPIIALTILAEAGDLRRFKHCKQFIKYCGFDLATYQSGNSKGKTALSKRGNSKLRQMFWMSATIATRMRENSFRKKYQQYIKEDPDNADLKRKAYVAVAAKMVRVVYSIIRYKTNYYCSYEPVVTQ
jgi:transposase